MKRILTKADIVEGFDHLIGALMIAYAVMRVGDFAEERERIVEWLNLDKEEASIIDRELEEFFSKTIE